MCIIFNLLKWCNFFSCENTMLFVYFDTAVADDFDACFNKIFLKCSINEHLILPNHLFEFIAPAIALA